MAIEEEEAIHEARLPRGAGREDRPHQEDIGVLLSNRGAVKGLEAADVGADQEEAQLLLRSLLLRKGHLLSTSA